MAPSEHKETNATAPSQAIRIGVYVLAAIVLLIVLWSLIEGGERDLWTRPAALLKTTAAHIPS